MTRKWLSFTDNAWQRMEDAKNLMVITGLMTFETPLDYQTLKTTIEQSLLRFRRFRQRLVPPLFPFMRSYWEDDPEYDIENHFEQVIIPPPADQKALQDLISRLMSTALDDSHPLWKFYFIEKFGNGSAFIARLHHSIADGIALMQVLLSMTQTSSEETSPGKTSNAAQLATQSTGQTAPTMKSSSLDFGGWSLKDFLAEAELLLTDRSYARYRLRQGVEFSTVIGRLALRTPDPPSVFKGPLGIEKRAAWSQPILLSEVKSIGKVFGCTVNDTLLTGVAGAMGHYLRMRGEPVQDVVIRSFIPVNLRPLELDPQLGNKFGLVFLSLPIGVEDPIERLRLLKEDMDELKASVEAIATYGILNLIGAAPPSIEDLAVDFFDSKGSTIITNVPGPQTKRYLAGRPISTIMAWVPQSGRISLGVSIVSYNGKVWVGIASDAGLVPDPDSIVTYFNTELKAMKKRAKQIQVEKQDTLQPMMSKLDQAIKALDELLTTNEDRNSSESLPPQTPS